MVDRIGEYPLFVPPSRLSAKGRKGWSAKEAKEYKDWLTDSMDERIRTLVRIFDEPFGSDPRSHLASLGQRIARALWDAQFSEEGDAGRRLTNAGYALAADMGLLVASYLLHAYPDSIRWETIRKPKSEMSYNLPVLKGFANGNHLDPVGGSIAEAAALLRGQRGPDVRAPRHRDHPFHGIVITHSTAS